MNRIVKAALWAIPPILVFVVLPRLLISIVPASLITQADALLGISISAFITNLAIFGIVLATLSALQTWAYKWSIVKPVASALHMITSYILLLFILGFGNPMTFGTANISISLTALGGQTSGIGAINITLISTFLALLVGVAVAMKTVQKYMKYLEDKRFHRLDLETEAQQAQQAQQVPAEAQTQQKIDF
jgi:hypothetical protein